MLRNYSAGSIYNSWLGVLENASQTTQQNLLLLRGMETPPPHLLLPPHSTPSLFSFLPFSPKNTWDLSTPGTGVLGCQDPPPPQLQLRAGAAAHCRGLLLLPQLSPSPEDAQSRHGGMVVFTRGCCPLVEGQWWWGGCRSERPCRGEGDTRSSWPSRRWQGQNVPAPAQPCKGQGLAARLLPPGPGTGPAPKTRAAFPHPSWAEPYRVQLALEHPPWG